MSSTNTDFGPGSKPDEKCAQPTAVTPPPDQGAAISKACGMDTTCKSGSAEMHGSLFGPFGKFGAAGQFNTGCAERDAYINSLYQTTQQMNCTMMSAQTSASQTAVTDVFQKINLKDITIKDCSLTIKQKVNISMFSKITVDSSVTESVLQHTKDFIKDTIARKYKSASDAGTLPTGGKSLQDINKTIDDVKSNTDIQTAVTKAMSSFQASAAQNVNASHLTCTDGQLTISQNIVYALKFVDALSTTVGAVMKQVGENKEISNSINDIAITTSNPDAKPASFMTLLVVGVVLVAVAGIGASAYGGGKGGKGGKGGMTGFLSHPMIILGIIGLILIIVLWDKIKGLFSWL